MSLTESATPSSPVRKTVGNVSDPGLEKTSKNQSARFGEKQKATGAVDTLFQSELQEGCLVEYITRLKNQEIYKFGVIFEVSKRSETIASSLLTIKKEQLLKQKATSGSKGANVFKSFKVFDLKTKEIISLRPTEIRASFGVSHSIKPDQAYSLRDIRQTIEWARLCAANISQQIALMEDRIRRLDTSIVNFLEEGKQQHGLQTLWEKVIANLESETKLRLPATVDPSPSSALDEDSGDESSDNFDMMGILDLFSELQKIEKDLVISVEPFDKSPTFEEVFSLYVVLRNYGSPFFSLDFKPSVLSPKSLPTFAILSQEQKLLLDKEKSEQMQRETEYESFVFLVQNHLQKVNNAKLPQVNFKFIDPVALSQKYPLSIDKVLRSEFRDYIKAIRLFFTHGESFDEEFASRYLKPFGFEEALKGLSAKGESLDMQNRKKLAFARNFAFDLLKQTGIIAPNVPPALIRFFFDVEENLETVEDKKKIKIQTNAILQGRIDPERFQGQRVVFDEDYLSVAIDPPFSAELDDAISVGRLHPDIVERRTKAGFRTTTVDNWIYVHIADPGRFISLGSPVFNYGRRRIDTCYLPGSFSISMLPESLGSTLSLKAINQSTNSGEEVPDSLERKNHCITFAILLDFRNGDILDYEVVPSIVSKIFKLTTIEAQAILDQRAPKSLSDPQVPVASILRKLMKVQSLRKEFRKSNGAVFMENRNLDFTRTASYYKDKANILRPTVENQKDVSQVVSEVMILANNVAAKFAKLHKLPMLYRSQYAKLQFTDMTHEELLKRNFDRTEQAFLSADPLPHRALGVDCYTQVTSPLRRFSDFICLYQIKCQIANITSPIKESNILDLIPQILNRRFLLTQLQTGVSNYWLFRFWELQHEKFQRRDSIFSLEAVVESRKPVSGLYLNYEEFVKAYIPEFHFRLTMIFKRQTVEQEKLRLVIKFIDPISGVIELCEWTNKEQEEHYEKQKTKLVSPRLVSNIANDPKFVVH